MGMNDAPTTPAPAETEKPGYSVPGTLGFDIYLASLGVDHDALKAPRTPVIGLYVLACPR